MGDALDPIRTQFGMRPFRRSRIDIHLSGVLPMDVGRLNQIRRFACWPKERRWLGAAGARVLDLRWRLGGVRKAEPTPP